MININDILQWKQEFGDIFQMEILGRHFIFRPLGREEYKQIIILDLELGDFQEAICFQAMIYPNDYDYSRGIAGVAEIMSDAILDSSGLHMGQAKQLLDEFRAEMMNYDYQVDCMIHEAFPEYSLEEISTWSVRKTMYFLSRAEWILATLKGVPLGYIDEALQQNLAQQQAYEQQQQQQDQTSSPPPPPQPYKREIRKELIEAPDMPPPKQVKQPAAQGAIQSEEELLAMLAGTGNKVSRPATSMDDIKPELTWFQHMDELKGDYD